MTTPIGLRLRYWRKARRMTIDDVADALGFTSPAISKLELGRRGLSVELLERWCAVLGISPSVVFDVRIDEQFALAS